MKKRSVISKMAFTVLLAGFYPVFVFFCGQYLGSEDGLLIERPVDSRYGNRLAQQIQNVYTRST